MKLRERALRLLARREHSRAELKRKLAPHGSDGETERLLDELEQAGYLSDVRYTEALARSRRGRYGSVRLAQELHAKGVADALARQALAEARAHDLEDCHALWQKRFGVRPASQQEKARQYRFLTARGFPAEVVERVLNEGGLQDPEAAD